MNYKKIHDTLISRAKTRNLEGYKEKHHIIPRCLGGNNEKINLVYLTAKEHYIIHKLLIKIYPLERKLIYAFWRMINDRSKNRYKASPKIYEEMRILAAKDLRERFENAPPESEIRRREGISKNNKKPKSPEHAKKIRNAKKGSKNPMFGIKGKNNKRSKPIFQYDLEGILIKEWDSLTEASDFLGIDVRTLYAAMKRKSQKTKGFKWRYKENI